MHHDARSCRDITSLGYKGGAVPCPHTNSQLVMARTHRSMSATEELPKFFGKHGFAYEDPNKIKRGGIGRFNWGTTTDDIDSAMHSSEFNFGRSRRYSNSNRRRSSSGSSDFAFE